MLLRLGILGERQLARVREAMAASQVMRLDSVYADVCLAHRLVSLADLEAAFAEQRRQRYRVRLGKLLIDGARLTPDAHRAVVSVVIQRLNEHGPEAYATDVEDSLFGRRAPATGDPEATHAAASREARALPGPYREAAREADAKAAPSIPLYETQEVPPDEVAAATRWVEQRRSSALHQNLQELERLAHRNARPPNGSAEPADEALVASAVTIELSSGESVEADRALLESDLAEASHAASRSGETSFVLDRVALTGSGSAEFEPDTYLQQKRRRTQGLRLGLAVVGAGLLVGAALALVAVVRNREALSEARGLLARADGVTDPGERRELLLQASDELHGLGTLGVDEELRAELSGAVRWGLLRAEAEALVAEGHPGDARALLERRRAEVPAEHNAAHQVLLRMAERRGHTQAAQRAEAAGELSGAVVAYRRALALGDPRGVAQARLASIRAELAREMQRAYERALASSSVADETRFLEAAKLISELFNEDPGAKEGLDELAFRRAVSLARDRLAAGDLAAARAAIDDARRRRPDAPEVTSTLRRLDDLDVLRREELAARRAEEQGELEEAIAAYERAKVHAIPAERRGLDVAIARCQTALSRRQEAQDRLRRRGQALRALQESRVQDAIGLLEPLLAEAEDPRSRALLELARKVRGMVYVPPGEFVMGSDPGAPARPHEQPRRTVRLSGYFIGRHEVTNQEYAAFVAEGRAPAPPHWTHPLRRPDGTVVQSFDPAVADHPVVHVTWREAAAYAAWRGGALPTEPQWEKAARGTDGRTYPWGEGTEVRAHVHAAPDRLRSYDTAPVGVHGDDASPYGAMDTAGNVSEWTADPFAPYPGAPTTVRLPAGRRTIRGGSHRWPMADARCAARDGAREDDYRAPTIGLRIVVEVPPDVPPLR